MNPPNKNYHTNKDFVNNKSLPTTPGFISFGSADGGFFFRFNDEDGLPILYSIAYKEAKKRDGVIRLLTRNAKLEKRYKIIPVDKKWAISITSGNHQEITRSKHYENESEAQKAMELLMIQMGVKGVKEKAPKYAFKIDLYPRDGESLAGVITNILNGENKKFRGVKTLVVTDFMREQLNEADREQEESLATLSTEEQISADDYSMSTTQSEASNLNENLIVELVNNADDAGGRKNWALNSRFGIRFKLMQDVKTPIGEQVKMKLLLHSIDNHDIQYQKMVDLVFGKDRTAYLSDAHQIEKEGIYRIDVLSAEKNKKLFGSTAFNAFKVF